MRSLRGRVAKTDKTIRKLQEFISRNAGFCKNIFRNLNSFSI